LESGLGGSHKATSPTSSGLFLTFTLDTANALYPFLANSFTLASKLTLDFSSKPQT